MLQSSDLLHWISSTLKVNILCLLPLFILRRDSLVSLSENYSSIYLKKRSLFLTLQQIHLHEHLFNTFNSALVHFKQMTSAILQWCMEQAYQWEYRVAVAASEAVSGTGIRHGHPRQCRYGLSLLALHFQYYPFAFAACAMSPLNCTWTPSHTH